MAIRSLVLADQERELRESLVRELRADGYAVTCAPSGSAVAGAIRQARPCALVLGDFDGPGANARLIERLRSGELTGEPDKTPVLVLTVDASELALLRCFEAGADDFLAKTASYVELRARLRALLWRCAGERAPRQLRVGALLVDLDELQASWAGQALPLTATEFDLLAFLASVPERVWTRPELLREVWGYKSIGKTRTVDAHAGRLRRKLAQAGAEGWIVNRRGIGYRLAEEVGFVVVEPLRPTGETGA
jgi:DNA-binding response OmpR family regulator